MVRKDTVKTTDRDRRPSRREILRAVAAGALGAIAAPRLVGAQTTRPSSRPATRPASSPTSNPASRPIRLTRVPTPWWLKTTASRARVVDIRSREILAEEAGDTVTLEDILDQGLLHLVPADTPREAWRRVLGKAERVVLKFNSVGDRVLGTNEMMARALVSRLEDAGYSRKQITLVEAPEFLREALGTAAPVRAWGEAVPVGRGLQQLAQYLYDADAIINVPLLKTHQIAGMSCCMKNLSHALLRHPARCHANGCSPFVGQVVGSTPVSTRLRLNIVNALRVVVDRGPDARPEDVAEYGGLLLGFDPLAVDIVGRSVLAMERRSRGLPPWFGVPYLDSAAVMRVGRWRPAEIERLALEANL